MRRALGTIFRPFTDDRGRIVRLEWNTASLTDDNDNDEADELFEYLLDGRMDYMSVFMGIPLLGVGIACALLHMPTWLILTITFIAGIVLAILGELYLRRPCFHSRGYEFIHKVVRNNSCPACGYSLHGLQEDREGFIVCSECGAAWLGMRMRATASPGDEAQRWVVKGRLHAVLHWSPLVQHFDHKGRPTNLALYRPCRNPESEYAMLCHRASRAIYENVSDKGFRAFVVLTTIGIGLFALMLYLGSRYGNGSPPWVYALIPVMAVCLFAAFLIRGGDPLVKGDSIERETLAQGLCPSCWELLEGVEPDPDGCTMCPECGSSWRVLENLVHGDSDTTPTTVDTALRRHELMAPDMPDSDGDLWTDNPNHS